MTKIHVFPDKTTLSQTFIGFLKKVLAEREELHIALSGGSTPKALFEYMAAHEDQSFPWEKTHFYFGDERCVPPSDAESNFKMTNDALLSKIDLPASNIHRIKGEEAPEQEAKRYGEELKKSLPLANGIPQFDVVMLGLGDDGHTVSIFPHEIGLWESPEICTVANHPTSGQQRVTITGKVVNAARHRAFLVTGAAKEEKVSVLLKGGAAAEGLPAGLVQKENLHWFLDEAAYSKGE